MTDKATLQKIAMPLLSTLHETAMTATALRTFPHFAVPKEAAVTDSLPEMFKSVLQIALHEEGHAAMMRHLDPDCAPEVFLMLRPVIQEEGVGIGIEGGRCGTVRRFDDPTERVQISAAGFLAELSVVDTLRDMLVESGDEDADDLPPTGMLATMGGGAFAGLLMHPSAAKAFPGMEDDADAIKVAMLKSVGITPEQIESVQEDERKRLTRQMAESMPTMLDGAVRFIYNQRRVIFDAALERAIKIFAAVMEQLEHLSSAADRIRAAGHGFYTDQDFRTGLAEAGKREKLHAWSGDNK